MTRTIVFYCFRQIFETADDSEVDRINELYDYCVERGYEFACVTASTPQGVEAWQENTGAEYPFYFMDKNGYPHYCERKSVCAVIEGGDDITKNFSFTIAR